LVVLVGTIIPSACTTEPRLAMRVQNAGGNPERGQQLIREYGCYSCHIVPGVTGANGLVGPPLTHWANRGFIAGELPNTAENLILRVQNPQAVESSMAMPNLGVSEHDARDIASYLYTIK
jgi:cytochrome c